MKKILLDGFSSSTTEESVRALLERYGPVQRVSFVRQGNADTPLVVAEMDIGNNAAALLTSRIFRYWHEGRVINAHALLNSGTEFKATNGGEP